MNPDSVYSYVIGCIRAGAYDHNDEELQMRCPSCGDEKAHFSINIRKALYNCFKCSLGGNIRYQIMKDRSRWSSLISGLLSIPQEKVSGRHSAICSLDGRPLSEFWGDSPLTFDRRMSSMNRAVSYCMKRGMTKDQILEYRVFIKDFDSRVYFPYWNNNGDITFWTGRIMDDVPLGNAVKTISSDESERPLYGRQVHRLRNDVVLVEGVFDHFSTPNSYALLGSNISLPQMKILRNDRIKRVFVILDPDATSESINVAKKLSNTNFKVYPVVINKYDKDPADIGVEHMTNIVNILLKSSPEVPQKLYFSL